MVEFLRRAASRLRSALSLGRADREFEQELAAHLEMLTEEHVRRGLAPDEARRQARLRLGGVTQLRETNRELQGLPILETCVQDVRYGWRVLRRKPAFTAVAVLTLALGIGANTAIFSVVNAVFLRPLPFPDANRIYVVKRTGNAIGGSSLSLPIYIAWQKQRGAFEHLALFGWRGPFTLTGHGEAERIVSAGASTELFSVLGVRPALGRDFRPEEGQPGGPRVAILSDRLWRVRFQADAGVLGRSITLDGVPVTIVGVLPRDFELPIPAAPKADLWLPIRVPTASSNPSNGGLLCLGLLKRGASPAQAEAALTPPLSELRRQFPNMFSARERASLQPLRSFIASRAGTTQLLIFGAVTLVLLIACANVANLTLAAGSGRQREIAVRTAMGAPRGRVARQLLTESMLLAVAGGLTGVGVCYALFNGILVLVPADLPHVGAIRIDASVLLFACGLSLVTGLLFGLLPAIQTSRLDLNAVLKKAGPKTTAGGHGRLRAALAANEIALSFVLLIGAALALQSLWRVTSVAPGFDAGGVLTFQLRLPEQKYATPAAKQAFLDEALARASALPGVEQAAMVNVLPFEGGPDILFSIEDGGGSPTSRDGGDANLRVASAKYFSVLRIPLERGRVFSDADHAAGAAPVTVINRAMARAFWPGHDPIGQRIWVGKPMGPEAAEPAPREIVGIVDDVREASLAQPPDPTIYIPSGQSGRAANGGFFVLRTGRPPLQSAPDVRAAVRAMDPEIPVTDVRSMQDVVAASTADWRLRAVLLGGFGALALFIAAIGVYGVIAYSVAQRTQELGVRIALGAARRHVLGLVLRQAMRTVLVGIAIGLPAAYGATRLMTNLVYGVTASDPLTFIAVAVALALVALIACYIPARRATRVDPLVALRSE